MSTPQKVRGLTFEEWKTRVDNLLEKFFGLSSEDFDDWDYYSAWMDGVSPGNAARKAVKAARGF